MTALDKFVSLPSRCCLRGAYPSSEFVDTDLEAAASYLMSCADQMAAAAGDDLLIPLVPPISGFFALQDLT